MKDLDAGYHLSHISYLGDRLSLIFTADDARKGTAFLTINALDLRRILAEIPSPLLHQALEDVFMKLLENLIRTTSPEINHE